MDAREPKPNLIVVCGPNASGKTRLGIAIARRVGGEILSVDSRQVYRGLDIGSGKDLAEYGHGSGKVSYHLIDIADPDDIYTLWRYQGDFYQAFRAVREREHMPVAVGGTGLYLEAVLKRYQVPNVPEDSGFRELMMRKDRDTLAAMLRDESPQVAERTDMSTRKRIVRGLEIARFARNHEVRWGHEDPPDLRPLVLGVHWPRAVLRRRIRERLEQRLAHGMIDEVRELRRRGLSDERLAMFGMEYRHITAFLRGDVELDTMREALYVDICRLAKRQETYFRGMERRGIPIHWVDGGNSDQAFAILREHLPTV
ncbi:MAG: tRNA (adenosine(37)-N6)-dimethylallyltransferase MiaA [Chitinivibrionales bacterium]|nr:tRNA (adenosine(37)-N6)-dimethylallyltransferase MiaA [Chitinivibrionales bacterium]